MFQVQYNFKGQVKKATFYNQSQMNTFLGQIKQNPAVYKIEILPNAIKNFMQRIK